jgi:branched-chain amino acid transport system ATP-binding protein
MKLLEARGLCSGYGFSTVVDEVDLDLEEGAAIAILGRNGVGKTTLVQTIMGLVRATRGSVRVAGRELAGSRPHIVARAGIALVPQGRRVFGPLSVAEHLKLASSLSKREGPWTVGRIKEFFPRLDERLGHAAADLSGGEQQMLAVARALLTNPRLILLDEPSEGLAPAVVRQIGEVIGEIRRAGAGVLLVEQDLRLAFEVADELRVMEKGRFVHAATVEAFRHDRPTARRLLGVG